MGTLAQMFLQPSVVFELNNKAGKPDIHINFYIGDSQVQFSLQQGELTTEISPNLTPLW